MPVPLPAPAATFPALMRRSSPARSLTAISSSGRAWSTYARELNADDAMLRVAQRYAHGSARLRVPGSTVEAELEVFAFISRANDDPRAFSLLAMVISLFETGYLASGAGLFEYDRALEAGSVGPWEAGGISPFQYECGQRQAKAEGREYDAFGATPA